MKIHNAISDLENTRKLSSSLRNRKLGQSLLYQNAWADLYYKAVDSSKTINNRDTELLLLDDFLNFGNKNIFSDKKWVSLISLWCGNSHKEKYIFKKQKSEHINYLWVDTSQEMLTLSMNELEGVEIEYDLLCTDFSWDNFKELIEDFTKEWRNRVFCFFSNTFWNINHTNIIDILYNMLNKWEQIWLDVRLRQDNSIASNMQIFNLHELNDGTTEKEKWFWTILKDSWIPLNSGFFSKKMKIEEGINALKIDFDFIFTKKIVTNIGGQITFLPEESLKCLQIYYYDVDSFTNFFSAHGFKLVDMQKKGLWGQFLFEKE